MSKAKKVTVHGNWVAQPVPEGTGWVSEANKKPHLKHGFTGIVAFFEVFCKAPIKRNLFKTGSV